MSKPLYESFNWIRDDLKYAGPKGGKAQFKGIAIYPTISGNGRKYVAEELVKSARTLVGKPVTVNHDFNRTIGHCAWAEYEDENIEYVIEIDGKYTEYIQKLQDKFRLTKEQYVAKWGRDPIYGVSVEANYRYHDEDCASGNCSLEPHGIIFNALSLVEDPEVPGVKGTTIELMEKLGVHERSLSEAMVTSSLLSDMGRFHGMPLRIAESYHSKILEKIEYMTKQEQEVKEVPSWMDKFVKAREQEGQPETPPTVSVPVTDSPCPEGQHRDADGQCVADDEGATVSGEADVVIEQDEEPCPEGQHRNSDGECVDDEVAEQEEPCPEGKHRDPETGLCVDDVAAEQQEPCPEGEHRNEEGECVPDMPASTSEETLRLKKLPIKEFRGKYRLGEPFAGYEDFADCVAKNSEKEDAEAYCVSIKKQAEGETLRSNKVAEAVNALVDGAVQARKARDALVKNQKACCNRTGQLQRQMLEVEARGVNHTGQIKALSEKLGRDLKEMRVLVEKANVPLEKRLKTDFEAYVKPIKEQLEAFNSKIESYVAPIKEQVEEFNGKLEGLQTLQGVYEELERKHEGFVAEMAEKRLAETQSKDAKITELEGKNKELTETTAKLREELDTVKLRMKPQFKELEQSPESVKEPVSKAPYTYGKP